MFGSGGIFGSPGRPGVVEAGAAGRMKITGVDIFLFDIPLNQPFRISIGEMKSAADVLVRIRTDQGVSGWGEACPFPPITGETQETTAAAAKDLRGILTGRDPLARGSAMKVFGAFVKANPSAVAAYDMAMFDILGRIAGLPLFRLLGGDRTQFETDITVGVDVPAKMADRSRKYVLDGYRTIKLKVGLDPDEDVRRVAAVREALGGGIGLRLDANQGWTVPGAISALTRMERFGIEFCEQPVAAHDHYGLKAVRRDVRIPIMADESCFLPSDAMDLVREEACDYLNIKLMKSAGIGNAVRIAQIADAAGMLCMAGCMIESKLALTAAAHVVASQPNVAFADLDGNSEHVEDPVIGGMTVENRTITLPETPGLGCDVDHAFLKRLRKI